MSTFVYILAAMTTAIAITGGVSAWAWAAAADWLDRRRTARRRVDFNTAATEALLLLRAIDSLDPAGWRPMHRRPSSLHKP